MDIFNKKGEVVHDPRVARVSKCSIKKHIMSDEEANVKISIQITTRMSARQSKCLHSRQSVVKEKMLTVDQPGALDPGTT